MTLCEMVWTPERARKVTAQVEDVTGQPCPCKRGLPCPFIKPDGSVSVRSDELRERVAG